MHEIKSREHLLLQSSPAISNTQGKQKLVRYSTGSLNSNVYYGKSNQREMKTVRYSGDSLYPVFEITELHCSNVIVIIFSPNIMKLDEKEHIIKIS